MEEHCEPQREDQVPLRARLGKVFYLGELAAVSEHESRQAGLLFLGEARHVGLRENVCRVLVIAGVSDRDADLVQACCPAQHRRVGLRGLALQALVDAQCESTTRSAWAMSTW